MIYYLLCGSGKQRTILQKMPCIDICDSRGILHIMQGNKRALLFNPKSFPFHLDQI